MSATSEHLLANRELLSLDRATLYLATRVRGRTPLGAAEFLELRRQKYESETYDQRISVVLECMEIFRQVFPEEYARSSAPYFSTEREHQLYRLIDARLFPLSLGEDFDLAEQLEAEPQFFLPYMPVCGIQKHQWQGGMFDFWQIEPIFQLVQVLSGHTGAGGKGWRAIAMHYGLHSEAPAPPLANVGWTLFCHACRVAGPPLRFLPFTFDMIVYRTGNTWLDLPTLVGHVGVEWSARRVAELLIARLRATEALNAIVKLDQWLREDLPARIAEVVAMWNDASRKEEESGYGGMNAEDLVAAGATPLGDGFVHMEMPAEDWLVQLLEVDYPTPRQLEEEN